MRYAKDTYKASNWSAFTSMIDEEKDDVFGKNEHSITDKILDGVVMLVAIFVISLIIANILAY